MTVPRTMLAAAAVLAACSTVPVYAPGLSAGVEAAIDVGLPVHVGAEEDALITVRERETLKYGGHAYDTHGCKRRAYVRSSWNPETKAVVTAHELGHALGLAHVDDVTNLMYPTAPNRHGPLTSKQRRTARRESIVLQACGVLQ